MRAADLWSRIEKNIDRAASGGCWLWLGWKNPDGYGMLTIGGRRCMAHRTTYEVVKGDIPPGLQLDHLCRVRACVNPAHLEPVTNRENACRGVGFAGQNARKTHCIRGHELAGGNVVIRRSKSGVHRECKACVLIRTRKRPPKIKIGRRLKISDEQVVEMIALRAQGHKVRRLADLYGCDKSLVSRICRGQRRAIKSSVEVSHG